MSYLKKSILILPLFIIISCVSRGERITYNEVSNIQKNITTEAQVRAMFGEPVASRINLKNNTKLLTYKYSNSNNLGKGLTGIAGGIAGGVLGSNIGNGSGSAILGSIGFLAGNFFANNAVTARKEKQILNITFDLKKQVVINYEFIEGKNRTQSIGFSSGVNTL